MKLLFDHHLSRKLVARLADRFAGSSHVFFHGLDRAEDEVIWDFARSEGYTIVTKDSDFSDVSIIRGAPPKVVWLRVGNCSTRQVETLLRTHHAAIEHFITVSADRVLEII